MPRKDMFERARKAAKAVGLNERLDHYPDQLSGGEQQRVAVARSLINEPKVIFADEPTGNLDSRNSEEVMKLLMKLNSEGQTIVMVTHSKTNAEFAHRIIEVADGRLKHSEAPIRLAV
jgi:putative ABC transport system ATP-binding protein